AATALHYGQEAFEGLKAYQGKDGQIRLFRVEENARRMISSAQGIMMAEVPEDLFVKAVKKVVSLNKHYVPPYDSGASLYVRPLLIGTGPRVGVQPSEEYLFMVFVTPVGPYFKEGFKLTNVAVMREYDRAAPQGTGNIKVGGNYAASLKAGMLAKEKGYSAVLYLDSREKKYIDECGPANFFGIKNNTYITPESRSILPSITNKSLIKLAEDLGMKTERRPVPFEEIETFEEVGQCGTAAVISPIGRVDDLDNNKSYHFSKNGKPGPVCQKLYDKLRALQYGEEHDPYGWVTVLD
ncbi:MAG: branched-chain amino acid aminotransferase, partial [Marinilabiliaceae bacterium]